MGRFHLVLILALEMVMFAMADYRIGYSILDYNSSNTLFDGSCCGGNCTANNCQTTLRLCFRDAAHSHADVESDCTEVQNRDNANPVFASAIFADSIAEYYPQTFQIYVRVSHRLNEETSLADFEVPFTDPLIDDVFIEANVEAVPFNSLILNSEIYTVTGDFGIATLMMAVHIRCAPNYSGDNCEMLCDSDGNNCSTVLSPSTIAPTTMAPTTTPNTTNQPDTPTAASLAPTTNVVPIAVGISVAVVILVVIGVVAVTLIIYFLKRSKKGSWNPKRNTQPHFTLERAERNLTSNVNRFSVISDNGEEVEYAIVNKPKSPAHRVQSPPTPPPPYSPDHQEDESPDHQEDESPIDNTSEITPAEDYMVRNKKVNNGFSGYETVDYGSPTTDGNGVRYASLDIHKGNGTISMEVEAEGADSDDQESIQYTIVKHQDS